MIYYFYFWLINCIVSVLLLIKYRKNILLLNKKYFRFLLIKWKVVTIIIATIGITTVGIISGDPTWDVGISLGISSLYFYTSPYAIGIIYRHIKGIYKNYIELYISIIICLFSSSWFYDGYNFLYLLGHYPETWTSNFIFSFPIYVLAGIFWSLEYKSGEGVIFSFSKKNWLTYKNNKSKFKELYLFIVPICLLITYIFGYFLYYFDK